MENTHNYSYKYLILFVIVVTLIIYTISSIKEKLSQTGVQTKNNIFTASGENLIKSSQEIEVTKVIYTKPKNLLNTMYKVGQENANLYSLSYVDNNLPVGQKLYAKHSAEDDKDSFTYASDQLYLIFRESYPNISVEDMGLKTEEEAYQAVQLAIWEIAGRTGEATYSSELSKIDSIRADIGKKYINPRVFEKAKQLVGLVEGYTLTNRYDYLNVVTTLIVSTLNVKDKMIATEDGSNLVGPYKYRVEAGLIADTKITTTEWDTGEPVGEIADSSGEKITDFKNIDEFYVKVPKNYSGTIRVKVQVQVKRLTPIVYMANDMDYIANSFIMVDTEQDVKISINVSK